jgi:hypothetical protein
MMKNTLKTGFADRLSNAQAAKQAMLAKFKPKPMVIASERVDRAAEREAELERVRAARAAEKEAARQAAAERAEAARQAALAAEQAALEAKRNERKDRKVQAKADARARKEDRMAMYAAMKAPS